MKWSQLRMPMVTGFLGACLDVGCGPNVQMIYEGNVRFEHCYRLDLDASIAPSHRRACWQDWLARHTYGQTGDRLAHARQRLDELSRGDQATLPLLEDAGVEQRQVTAPVPMPTNIHSAPPPKAPEAKPVLAPVIASAPAKQMLPESECARGCQAAWEKCSPSCDDASAGSSAAHAGDLTGDAGLADPKSQKATCTVCTRTYRSCMRRCFR